MSEDEKELLARLDERVKSIQSDLQKLVTRTEFVPVKLISFGIAALVLVYSLNFILGKVFGHP